LGAFAAQAGYGVEHLAMKRPAMRSVKCVSFVTHKGGNISWEAGVISVDTVRPGAFGFWKQVCGRAVIDGII
jgi:hypothetical protein